MSKLKIKIPQIKFNDANAYSELATKGKVYTIRSKRYKNITHEVKSKFLVKNQKMFAHVNFISEFEIYKIEKTVSHMILLIKPFDILDDYVKESGFSIVDAWLEALKKFRIQIPEYPKTRTFYLHSVEKIP